MLDNIFEEQVKDASARKEEIDEEEDALEYDFEGKYVEAELWCKLKGQTCKWPLPQCCGYMECKGKTGSKKCQCQADGERCGSDKECCSGSCSSHIERARCLS